MTLFEAAYGCARPFLLPLHGIVRRQLRGLVRACPGRPRLLDVGGRKSPYTIGLAADVTITERPRETDVQHRLHLGITPEIARQTRRRRSNVTAVLLDDMTRSTLPDAAYDLAVAVEVLEHVPEDEAFVREVYRVLRPGGVFLMTTPNGDFVPNTNPDHVRHYARAQLDALLRRHFDEVEVDYAVADGPARARGLVSWSLRRPLRTIVGMASNVVNALQSARPGVRRRAEGTHHLIARARKRG